MWKNNKTEVDSVSNAIIWLETLKKEIVDQDDSSNLETFIINTSEDFSIDRYSEEIEDLAFNQLIPNLNKLDEKALIDDEVFYSNDVMEADFEMIHAKINDFIENEIYLVDWKNFNVRYNKLVDMGLEDIVNHLLENRIDPYEYSERFERTVLLNVFEQIKSKNSILGEFEADTHREIEAQFKEYDKQLMEYAKYEILYNLSQANPKADPDWKPAAGGDYGYINKQILAKRGGHSVRKIFEKQAEMIQKICPCFMMSPLSAQYIIQKN